MKRFFIVAGEASGDAHAAKLMAALRGLYPGCTFEGIGGDAMSRQGLQSIVSMSDINVVGFWEVAKRYTFFKKLLAQCAQLLHSSQYDAFIPVDYPGFNIRLSAEARRRNIPVCFYIAPQLWAWGSNRAKKLCSVVDVLLVVLPFETAFFEQFGIKTKFVGHPLLDDPELADGFVPIGQRDNVIALMPGSRAQEVQAHLPILLQTAELLCKEEPSFEVVIAAPNSVHPSLYAPALGRARVEYNSRSLMKRARVGVVKAGTSTLEAALCGMPFVMMYKTSTLSYMVARQLVRLPSIALANIIAQKRIVHECIQREARPAVLAAELLRLVRDTHSADAMQEEFRHLRRALGDGGASVRAAQCIAEVVGL